MHNDTVTRDLRALAALLAVALFGMLLASPPARAAQYAVLQCLPGMGSAEAWTSTTAPGAYFARDECGGAGFLLSGQPWRSVGIYQGITSTFFAPDGTRFRQFKAKLTGYQTSNAAITAEACALAQCPQKSLLVFGLSGQQNFAWSGDGAALVFSLLCTGWSYPSGCSWTTPPSLRISGIDVVLDDAFRPTASITGGALASGGWKRGWQSVEYAASDRGAGILKAELILGGTSYGYHLPTCAPRGQLGKWTRLQPCPRSVRSPLAANLSSVADGTHRAHVRVTDASGQATASAPFDVKVDQTAPAGPNGLAIDGGEGWRADPDLTARWENPIEDHAPITAARWRLCPVASGPCREGRAAAEDITGLRGLRAPGEGEYELSIWLEDAAGNHDATRGRRTRFRVDSTAPHLVFDETDPTDPAKVAVSAVDELSGIASGDIELRRRGGSAWHALPTTIAGDKLTAFVDDERFEPGAYEFRAFARDRAGNESSTDRRASGATMGLDLPLRIGTRLRAGVARKIGKRTRLRKELSVPLGTRVTVRGSLLADGGQPLDDAELQVFARPSFGGGEERLVGLVRTKKNGRFTYRARATASRVLRFRFAGTRRIVGANREVDLQVAAGTTLRASDRTVRVGETVMFSGRLQTRPAPPGGKLVEVQAFFRDQWRTFSTVRTDARGRWSFPYVFSGTVGVVRYGFRVLLPYEGGYPFAPGRSRRVSILVHGL